jgi:hypothetical protein
MRFPPAGGYPRGIDIGRLYRMGREVFYRIIRRNEAPASRARDAAAVSSRRQRFHHSSSRAADREGFQMAWTLFRMEWSGPPPALDGSRRTTIRRGGCSILRDESVPGSGLIALPFPVHPFHQRHRCDAMKKYRDQYDYPSGRPEIDAAVETDPPGGVGDVIKSPHAAYAEEGDQGARPDREA